MGKIHFRGLLKKLPTNISKNNAIKIHKKTKDRTIFSKITKRKNTKITVKSSKKEKRSLI
jgi:hypothetical protein